VGKVLCYLPKVKDEDPELLEQDVKHEANSNQHRTDGEQDSGAGRLSQGVLFVSPSHLSLILLRVYHTMYEIGTMFSLQKMSYITLLCKEMSYITLLCKEMSYITLLCKDEKHPELPKKYRPISLLNVDYDWGLFHTCRNCLA